ncbi:MAG: flippase-like domain-containing protein [Fibrobacteres bacterium]|nr:flippase-like domain-containing protein [Fibrobacterota bacterium]
MKKKAFLITRIAVTAALLIYLLNKYAVSDIWSALKTIDPLFFLLSILASLSGIIFSSLQNRQIAGILNIKFTTIESVKISLISLFYSLTMPGEIGGAIAKWAKFKEHGASTGNSLSLLLISRYFYSFVLIILSIFSFSVDNPFRISGLQPIAISLAAVSLLSAVMLLQPSIANTMLRKFPLLLTPVRQINGASALQKTYFFIFPLASQTAGLIAFFFMLHALNIELSLSSAFWIMGASAIIQMAPIHIGGFGVREVSLIYFLSLFSIPGHEALALSTASVISRLVISLIGGFLELSHLRRKIKNG